MNHRRPLGTIVALGRQRGDWLVAPVRQPGNFLTSILGVYSLFLKG
jgi:hypothetical protein